MDINTIKSLKYQDIVKLSKSDLDVLVKEINKEVRPRAEAFRAHRKGVVSYAYTKLKEQGYRKNKSLKKLSINEERSYAMSLVRFLNAKTSELEEAKKITERLKKETGVENVQKLKTFYEAWENYRNLIPRGSSPLSSDEERKLIMRLVNDMPVGTSAGTIALAAATYVKKYQQELDENKKKLEEIIESGMNLNEYLE